MKTEITARSAPKRPKKAKTDRKAVQPVEPPQLVPGYRGLMALALNSGQVTSINAQAVHRNDRFDYAYGLNERLEHVPAEGDRGDVTHFYAYARFKDGGHCFDVLSRAEVDAVRDRSEGCQAYAELGKEMALRRISGYLPLAVRKAAALEELGEIEVDPPKPVKAAPAEEPAHQVPQALQAPQALDLTEEEIAGLFPPGHIMRILDAAYERDIPDEVLAEIAGVPIDEVSAGDESTILRAIASWQR